MNQEDRPLAKLTLRTPRGVCSVIAAFLLALSLGATPACLPPAQPPSGDGSLRDVLERERLGLALEESLRYLDTPRARQDYAHVSAPFTLERVRRSLKRLQVLLRQSEDLENINKSLKLEFQWIPMGGQDTQGTVALTGYFTPAYEASRQRQGDYIWPLYRRPQDLEHWALPHPTRAALEGVDGLGGPKGRLKGQELLWLKNRWDAYMIQVQGSAQVQLPDGTRVALGFHGATQYSYTPITSEMSRDKKIQENCLKEGRLNLRQHFQLHPEDLDTYLRQNNRFVFFKEVPGPPRGSLGVPVTPMRSVAIDRSLYPSGIPLMLEGVPGDTGQAAQNHLVLAQDAGSAILGPGRLDLYCGIGPEAGAQAGRLVHAPVRAYLMLLKDEPEKPRP